MKQQIVKPKMRIGIDISSVYKENTGVGNYTYNLVKNLIKIDKTNEYHIFAYPEICEELVKFKNTNFFLHQIQEKHFRFIRLPIKLSLFLYKKKLDVFHCPYHIAPIFSNSKIIATVHDLANFIFPEKFDKKHKFVYNIFYPYLIKKSSAIIAVSENTKLDLMKIFNIPEEKIHIIYEAMDEMFVQIKDKTSLTFTLQKFGITQPYILYVGTIEPRKNLDRLIQAWNILKKEKKIPHKFVIVGKKGWLYENIYKEITNFNTKYDIIFTDYVPSDKLLNIYNAADLFVYPSIYEGFGIPPLEAMSCGVPVIASNTSSFGEILGDSVIGVNPYSVDEIANTIYTALTDIDLRKQLIKKGLERIKCFSWEKTARETLNLYEKVVNA